MDISQRRPRCRAGGCGAKGDEARSAEGLRRLGLRAIARDILRTFAVHKREANHNKDTPSGEFRCDFTSRVGDSIRDPSLFSYL